MPKFWNDNECIHGVALGAHCPQCPGEPTSEQAELTMMTFETDTPQSCGIVELDENNLVQAFHEKVARPPSNLANGAVYLISPAGLARIKSMGPIFEFSTQVIPEFIGKIYCWQNTTYHRDIGNPQAYEAAQSEFRPVAEQFGLKTE